jgi:hypothetical protein
MPGVGQPIPDHECNLFLQDGSLRGRVTNWLQHVQFILPGAGQEGAHQIVLAFEHEEQDTG